MIAFILNDCLLFLNKYLNRKFAEAKKGRGFESLKTESVRISRYIHQISGVHNFFGIDL